MAGPRTRPTNARLLRIVDYALNHPRRVLALWAPVIVAMAVIGLHIQSALAPVAQESLDDGPTAKATAQEREKFGRGELLVISLEGAPRQLDTFGPRVVRSLNRRQGLDVVDPWSRGGPQLLPPNPRAAVLMVEVDATLAATGERVAPEIRKVLERELPQAVRANMTGIATIGAAMRERALTTVAKAERVAIPFLAVILLLIFRSPIAAALPLALGLSVITVGRGALTVAGQLFSIDSMALSTMSIMGLALGVDYSLLVVSRFRDELARGRPTADALRTASATAGRSVLFAGATVAAGVASVTIVLAEPHLRAAAFGVVLACLLSLAAALSLLPALLGILGPRIDLWRIGRRDARPLVGPLVERIIRHPAGAAVAVLLPLLALATPALGLKTGPLHPADLGADHPEVRALKALERIAGAGWGIPYSVLVTSGRGPITTPVALAKLSRFQDSLASDPTVAAVVGPGALAESSQRLQRAALGLDRLSKLGRRMRRARRGLVGLQTGLAQAAHGSAALVVATTQAATGGAALGDGAGQAAQATAALDQGLRKTEAGAATLARAISRIGAGAGRLATAAASAQAGAESAADAAWSFRDGLDANLADLTALADAPAEAETAAETAKSALDGASLASKSDPNVQAAYRSVATVVATLSGIDPLSLERVRSDYQGMSEAIERARTATAVSTSQARSLLAVAQSLSSATGGLASKNGQLVADTRRARAGALQLRRALSRAAASSSASVEVTNRMKDRATALAPTLDGVPGAASSSRVSLQGGVEDAAGLRHGLARIARQVPSVGSSSASAQSRTPLDPQLATGSGYATLAAIDGSDAAARRNANLVINANRGGDAARFFVMLNRDPVINAEDGYYERLRAMGDALGRGIGAKVHVGGRAAISNEFDRVTKAKRLQVFVLLSIVTFLFLVVVFRSPLLAAKAVALNLLVVATALGVTALAIHGPVSFITGPGWMDAVAFFTVYTIVFTLSMDYEIFMIARMREGYLETGSNTEAIQRGIQGTARVITGGAAIMVVIFTAFAAFGSGMVQQLGLALAVAVVVDATLVRLILLPATMRLLGNANWWLPRWLDRLLPRLDLEAKGNVH